MKFRKAELDQQKFQNYYEHIATPIIRQQNEEVRQLAEKLSSEGTQKPVAMSNQMQKLHIEHMRVLVDAYIDALFKSIERNKYINEKLKLLLIQKTLGFLDKSVEMLQIVMREGLNRHDVAHQNYISGLYSQSLSIRQDLNNKIFVKVGEFNAEYKGCLKLLMEHELGGEIVRAIIKWIIPILGSILLAYFAYKGCRTGGKKPQSPPMVILQGSHEQIFIEFCA